MMKLYIQVENGEPVNHPSYEEHVLLMHGGVIPENWEPFVRILRPPKEYKHQYISPHAVRYEKNSDGVWTDVFEIRPMTDEERYNYDLIEVEELKRLKAETTKTFRIEKIKEMIKSADLANDQEQVQLLRTVLDAHTFHVFKSYHPIDPPFMKFPRQDENGKWYIPE